MDVDRIINTGIRNMQTRVRKFWPFHCDGWTFFSKSQGPPSIEGGQKGLLTFEVAVILVGVPQAVGEHGHTPSATFGVVKMPPWPTRESTYTCSCLVITSMPILTGERSKPSNHPKKRPAKPSLTAEEPVPRTAEHALRRGSGPRRAGWSGRSARRPPLASAASRA